MLVRDFSALALVAISLWKMMPQAENTVCNVSTQLT